VWRLSGYSGQMSVAELRVLIAVAALGALVLAAFSDERLAARNELDAVATRFRALAGENEAILEKEREDVSREIDATLGPQLSKLESDLHASARQLAARQ